MTVRLKCRGLNPLRGKLQSEPDDSSQTQEWQTPTTQETLSTENAEA